MQIRFVFSGAIFVSFAVLISPGQCAAQNVGYVAGGSSISSFSPATGALINTLPNDLFDGAQAFAVANDDVTLSAPSGDQLNAVSGRSGKILNDVVLSGEPRKVVLSSDGATAYVLASAGAGGQLLIVDAATLGVTGSLTVTADLGSTLYDIAVSPSGAAVYVSLECLSDFCSAQYNACPITSGICVFDAKTLELKGQTTAVTGLLAMSQDGNSLYVTPKNGAPLDVVNTKSLAVTTVHIPNVGTMVGPVALSPASNYGLIFATGQTVPYSTTAYVLNTSTNKVVSQFFPSVPDGAELLPYNQAVAFAPKGGSVWMLLVCHSGAPNCVLPGGALRALAGFNFPAGTLIGQTGVSYDTSNIAFPW